MASLHAVRRRCTAAVAEAAVEEPAVEEPAVEESTEVEAPVDEEESEES